MAIHNLLSVCKIGCNLEIEICQNENVVIEYWYTKILIHLSDDRQATYCFIDHLVDFYSRERYEETILYLQNALYVKFIKGAI